MMPNTEEIVLEGDDVDAHYAPIDVAQRLQKMEKKLHEIAQLCHQTAAQTARFARKEKKKG